MDQLKVTLVQSDLHWENRKANLDHFSSLIAEIKDETDIIILPEMFTTGFSMAPEQHAETMDGEALAWMKKIAHENNVVVCGSLMMNDHGKFYNRLIWMQADGTLRHYDKRHLFRMGDEQLHYTPGNSRMIIEHKGWKILPLICYDLRFPVWMRRTKEFDYELAIMVANWPEKRVAHWKALLQARAIENQCFLAGVNRVGDDGYKIHYSGESSLINPKGEIIFQQAGTPFTLTFTLRKDELIEYRNAFPVIEDGDNFSL